MILSFFLLTGGLETNNFLFFHPPLVLGILFKCKIINIYVYVLKNKLFEFVLKHLIVFKKCTYPVMTCNIYNIEYILKRFNVYNLKRVVRLIRYYCKI